MEPRYPFSSRHDPLQMIQQMAKTESMRRISALTLSRSMESSPTNRGRATPDFMNSPVSRISPSKFRRPENQTEMHMAPAVEQLTEWKNQFSDRLFQVQEEMLTFLLQKDFSAEELGIMIRSTFSDFKLSISELLTTMSLLIKQFIKRSKKMLENSDLYWQTIVTDLSSQLEHMTRAKAVEDEKRKELEKEVKKLKLQIKSMKSQYTTTKMSPEYVELAKQATASPKQVPQTSTPTKRGLSQSKSTPSPRPKSGAKVTPNKKETPKIKTINGQNNKEQEEKKKEEEEAKKRAEEEEEKRRQHEEEEERLRIEEERKKQEEIAEEEKRKKEAEEEKESTTEAGQASGETKLSARERLAARRAGKPIDGLSSITPDSPTNSGGDEDSPSDARSRLRDRLRSKRTESMDVDSDSSQPGTPTGSEGSARDRIRERLRNRK